MGIAPLFAGEPVDRACCVRTDELQEIGLCVSGPRAFERPSECGETGRCYIAVGGGASGVDSGESGSGGDQAQSAGFLHPRAYCSSSFKEQDVQSTLIGGYGIDLFTVFDDDQDGDLDLRDVAVFMETYEPAPKRVQSDARMVAAECCFSIEDQRGVGVCLSGPGVNHPIASCENQGRCVVGFDGVVGPGDLMYKLCSVAPFVDLDPAATECASWSFDGPPVTFTCNASYIAGVTPFSTFDADGDGDFDLGDLAGAWIQVDD